MSKSLRNSYLLALLLTVIFVLVGLQSKAEVPSATLRQEYNPDQKFYGQWRLELGFESFEEEKDDSKLSGAAFRSRGYYKLTNNLQLKGDFRIKAVAGRIQDRFDAGQANNISVKESTVYVEAAEVLFFEAGVLNQDYLANELLIPASGTFPGVIGGVKFVGANWSSRLYIQQSIPSSTSLNTERVEKEELPYFNVETLELSYKSPKLRLLGNVSHYAYTDLPAKVAAQSYITGNELEIFQSDANASFKFPFNGWAASGQFEVDFTKALTFRAGTRLIENLEAEEAYSRGQILFAGLRMGFRTVDVTPGIVSFFNESDTVPSYYGMKKFGGNNRIGDSLGLEIKFNSLGFRIIGEYGKTEPINESQLQRELNYYLVKLETLYATF